MYKYLLYGYILITNEQIPILEKAETMLERKLPKIYMNVDINTSNFTDEIIYIEKKVSYYHINLSIHGYYDIYYNKKIIYAYITSKKSLISTILNIPFSVYLLLEGKILLHCSSIIYEDKVYCFCGKKGVGKSTVLINLIEQYKYYSDDTLALNYENNNIYCYNSTKYIKVKEYNNIENNIIKKDVTLTDAQGKYLVRIDVCYNNIKALIGKVILLDRDERNNIKYSKVENVLLKNIMISSSIVGFNYMNEYLINRIQGNTTFINLLERNEIYRFSLYENNIINDTNVIKAILHNK